MKGWRHEECSREGSAGRMLRKASLFGFAPFMLSGSVKAEAPAADHYLQ
jgi:hypothetical protein